MREILRNAGYAVLDAAAPEPALEVLEGPDAPPDLLITDVRIPGSSGFEIAERALSAHPGLAVLLVSPHPDDASCAGRLGLALLRSPFVPAALLAAVRAGLDRPPEPR